MQITFLSLRNFRVFPSLDLEIPPGLVGIYGPNGAGKSTLLEAVLWALYGRARTGKADIRTAGTSVECSVELSFVHEDHQYVVRRSISGVNSTVKARVEIGGQTVADGPTEVGRFLRSTLGMEEAAFRSSVFAEQKQLSAFSDATPETRRRLVLQLLGITPIEKARDSARSDARSMRADHERLLHLLPDLAGLAERDDRALTASGTTSANLAWSRREHETATAALGESDAALRELEELRSAHALITQKGKAARAERDRAAAALLPLEAELARLLEAQRLLSDLPAPRPAERRDADAKRLVSLGRFTEALAVAEKLRSQLAGVDSINALALVASLREELDEMRRSESAAKSDEAAARAFLTAADDRAARASESFDRSAALTAEASCPLCGQELGSGFTAVQQHRVGELNEARELLDDAKRRVTETTGSAGSLTKLLGSKERELAVQVKLADSAVAASNRLNGAEDQLAEARERSGLAAETDVVGLHAQLESAIRGDRDTDQRRAVLTAQLDRLPAVRATIEQEQGALERADAARSTLRAELTSLNFDARMFATLEARRNDAAATLATRTIDLQTAATAVAKAEQECAAVTALLTQARAQHATAAQLAEEVRYIARSADLLHGFRQQVVAAIGPRLEIQASELFNVLTNGDYDGVTLDPDTYEISIVDAGIAYPSSRFSGSEVDLANLALRVAISEQVRFQAGGQVGLLVLDEALASLDADRKDRMLGALTQLSGRFRQILVVTHAPEVKERLPQAIEVVKLPGRRATARVVEIGSG